MQHHNCQDDSLNKSARCDNCVFGICPGCTYPGELDCHRHAPSVRSSETQYTISYWPRVKRLDLCGDYVRREFRDE